MKHSIRISEDDPTMRPLYTHLAALPVKPGKPYRARVLCALLEVGAGVLLAPDDPGLDDLIRAARSIGAGQSDASSSGGPIRIDLVLPDTPALRSLRQRLDALPGGQGAQARGRLVAQVLQAAVQVVYRDLPVPTSTRASDAAAHPAPTPAQALPEAVQPDMAEFFDNLSLEGL